MHVFSVASHRPYANIDLKKKKNLLSGIALGLVRVLSSTKWGNGVRRLLDQERGGRIGKARSMEDPVPRARFLSLFLSSFLFIVVFSAGKPVDRCCRVSRPGFCFSLLILLWVLNTTEELVFEISVLHTLSVTVRNTCETFEVLTFRHFRVFFFFSFF